MLVDCVHTLYICEDLLWDANSEQQTVRVKQILFLNARVEIPSMY